MSLSPKHHFIPIIEDILMVILREYLSPNELRAVMLSDKYFCETVKKIYGGKLSNVPLPDIKHLVQSLSMIMWSVKDGYVLTFKTFMTAAAFGKMDVLYFLRDSNCSWNSMVCTEAAKNGHLNVIKWLRDREVHGEEVCPWNYVTCSYAAKNGHLNVLKWLRDREVHGDQVCPWNEDACAAAASKGRLNLLKWLRNREVHGEDVCPWDVKTCTAAVANNHLHVLKWLRDRKVHGEDVCPWNDETLKVAAKNGLFHKI